ncbi:hypothetical protein GCM10010302_28150 [Streptomyces polychromogenes]|uniref:Uncharacterized protein n=1 Tax=Streptomyces polychromogenes TaxID=67342 RepID=A0ABP3F066_9ACTN
MTTHPRPSGAPDPDAPRPAPPAEGGEPACLLHRVCPACGRLAEDPSPYHCAHCGTELPE